MKCRLGIKLSGSGWIVALLVVFSSAPVVNAQFTRCITRFEPSQETFDCGSISPSLCDEFTGIGAQVIWRSPTLSGTTEGLILGDQIVLPVTPINYAQTRTNTNEAFMGLASPSYELTFAWADPTEATTAGVRLTTLNTTNFPDPSVHLGGKIRFKMAVTAFEFDPEFNFFGAQVTSNAAVYMCLAIRETGNAVAQGDEDNGGGDLEYVYLPASELIPATTSGLIPFPPFGKRFAASSEAWPPDSSEFVPVEFDLGAINSSLIRGFANNGDGIDTAGDGALDATAIGDGVNRGVLESIIFSPDPTMSAGQYYAIYIDDVEFEAPVADPTIAAPSVQPPLFSNSTEVNVITLVNDCDGTAVDSVELFVNGVSATATTNPITTGLEDGATTFTGVTLNAGDVVTAKQTRTGVTSDFSQGVTVFEPGVLLAENFDGYASNADLNDFWGNSINNPIPSTARVNLRQGGAASCENFVEEFNPSGADGARLWRSLGSVNGTDLEPLTVTWDFQHRGEGTFGSRFRFELARFDGSFSSSSAARLEGTTGIVHENGPSTVPLPQTLNEYNILLFDDTPTNGFFAGNQNIGSTFEEVTANTGITRTSDVWHRCQIVIDSSTINYFIDEVSANPVDTNGVPLWPGGVPRPNGDPYTHIIIGQGFSNNGPAFLIDNVMVTLGTTALPFGPANPVPSPTVVGPLLPGPDPVLVTVIDVDSNATEVALSVNGTEVASTNAFGPDPVVFELASLAVDAAVSATQTVGGTESCTSIAVVAGVPAPTVPGPLLIDDTAVRVADVVATAGQVNVYVNGSLAGSLDVSAEGAGAFIVPIGAPLVVGDVVTASQVILGSEGPLSSTVEVSLPICLVVFEDDFDTDSSASWNVTVVDEAGTDDAAATFAFDYGTEAGVPPSPRGSGTTFGLKVEANNFINSPDNEAAAVTASPAGLNLSTNGYRMIFDMWMNFSLTLSGSTEFMTMGVGYDGVTANFPEANGSTTDAINGSGAWFALTGETGAGQDVRAYKDTAVQTPASGQFAAGTGLDAQYLDNNTLYTTLFGAPEPPAAQTALVPTQTGLAPTGSPSFVWHPVELTVLGPVARWSVANTTFVTLDSSVTQAIDLSGNVSLGYTDVFNSVTDVPAMAFGLADNLKVLQRHTPGVNGDYDGDSDVDTVDNRYIIDCMSGPTGSPAPPTGATCAGLCLTVFDQDGDLDVDLRDYAAFQRNAGP